MNFDHMPEKHWIFSYPLIMGLVFGVCAGLWAWFRKSGWL
jgi:magnesium transporter